MVFQQLAQTIWKTNIPSFSTCTFFAYSSIPSLHFLACSFLGRFLTCSSTTVLACCIAAEALVHTLPHPQPPELWFGGGWLGTDASVFGAGDDDGGSKGAGLPPPTLTLSVLFLREGVPDLEIGLSGWTELVDRLSSALFWVISSKNARASAASSLAGGGTLTAVPEELFRPPWASGGGAFRESKSSKNWRASSCFDLDFDDMAVYETGVLHLVQSQSRSGNLTLTSICHPVNTIPGLVKLSLSQVFNLIFIDNPGRLQTWVGSVKHACRRLKYFKLVGPVHSLIQPTTEQRHWTVVFRSDSCCSCQRWQRVGEYDSAPCKICPYVCRSTTWRWLFNLTSIWQNLYPGQWAHYPESENRFVLWLGYGVTFHWYKSAGSHRQMLQSVHDFWAVFGIISGMITTTISQGISFGLAHSG